MEPPIQYPKYRHIQHHLILLSIRDSYRHNQANNLLHHRQHLHQERQNTITI